MSKKIYLTVRRVIDRKIIDVEGIRHKYKIQLEPTKEDSEIDRVVITSDEPIASQGDTWTISNEEAQTKLDGGK